MVQKNKIPTTSELEHISLLISVMEKTLYYALNFNFFHKNNKLINNNNNTVTIATFDFCEALLYP